jgi:CBS domain-containing protein
MQLNGQLVDPTNLYQVIDRYPLTINRDSHVVDAIVMMNQQQSHPLEIVYGAESLPRNKERKKTSSYVLVVEERRLLGIFTLKDVLRLTASGSDLFSTKITEVMTQELITLKESDFQDIATALSILQQHGIHHLPIVDDGEQLVGIVTESALLAELDVVKLFGVVDSIQEYIQQSQKPINTSHQSKYHNQQTKEVYSKTKNILNTLIAENIAKEIKINEELQQTL